MVNIQVEHKSYFFVEFLYNLCYHFNVIRIGDKHMKDTFLVQSKLQNGGGYLNKVNNSSFHMSKYNG